MYRCRRFLRDRLIRLRIFRQSRRKLTLIGNGITTYPSKSNDIFRPIFKVEVLISGLTPNRTRCLIWTKNRLDTTHLERTGSRCIHTQRLLGMRVIDCGDPHCSGNTLGAGYRTRPNGKRSGQVGLSTVRHMSISKRRKVRHFDSLVTGSPASVQCSTVLRKESL